MSFHLYLIPELEDLAKNRPLLPREKEEVAYMIQCLTGLPDNQLVNAIRKLEANHSVVANDILEEAILVAINEQDMDEYYANGGYLAYEPEELQLHRALTDI